MNAALRCPLCIAGLAPAGIHPVFGAVYVSCPLCRSRCLRCHGRAVFPALLGYPLELLIDALDHVGVTIGNCRGCLGLMTPAYSDTNTEVQP